MRLLVEKKLIFFPTNDEEDTRASQEYTGFTHKFTFKQYPIPTNDNIPIHKSNGDKSNKIVNGTSLNSTLSWIHLQASHS